MRRIIGALAVVVAVLAGCARGTPRPVAGAPVHLTFWVAWSGPDVKYLQGIVDGFTRLHPTITATVVGDQSDTSKLLAAINAGSAPDLDANSNQEDIGKFCTTGAFEDLGPRMAADHIKPSLFPARAIDGVTFAGHRCALPYLGDTFGLYYNKALLAKAGFTAPPRTMSQLTTMAEKLTQRNSDGSIAVAGLVPLVNFYENYLIRFAPMFDAPFFDATGHASLTDARWVELMQWVKGLVDFYGYDKLSRFTASAGDEYSSSNDFETGKIAMVIDGEWRTGLIAQDHPALQYDTAPPPVSDAHPERYGASEVSVGLLGIPKGAAHPDAAWQLAKYLAVETDPLVAWANYEHNVPTTLAAISSPQLKLGPTFQPFLDAFRNPHSSFPTILAQGSVYFDPVSAFAEKWQAGNVADLGAGLAATDRQIDALVAQG